MLRELGDKVKTMTKLTSIDILAEVHAAAEELQKKIDQKSYLLVNAESWEVSKQGNDATKDGTSDVIASSKPILREKSLHELRSVKGSMMNTSYSRCSACIFSLCWYSFSHVGMVSVSLI